MMNMKKQFKNLKMKGFGEMNEIPLIDWNGNGKIDPTDISLTLAIAEDEAAKGTEDDDDI